MILFTNVLLSILDIPSDSEIDTQFKVNNESKIVTTFVRFQKMYPEPRCVVYANVSAYFPPLLLGIYLIPLSKN